MTRETDEKLLKQHVNTSLRVFTAGTFIFILVKTAILYSQTLNTEADNTQSSTNNNLFKIAFAVLFFLFTLFTNVSVTKNKLICGKENHWIAFMATLIPFIFIYSIGLFALWAFDGWTDCFSETWGKYIVEFCGIENNGSAAYINSKRSVGEGVWNYLLGVITILVSFNTILAENCNAFSIKKDEYKKYLNDKYANNKKK
tara:strand:- start:741 stop:1340 length:600 start_codon:yes stop_codon:yes gene_type:complete